MVTIDQVQNGIAAYYEREIAQKANGLGQFAAYFFLPSISSMVSEKINMLRASPLGTGIINADGLIDLDTARERAMSAMQHCGSVDIMGFRLNQNDVENLYEYIRRS